MIRCYQVDWNVTIKKRQQTTDWFFFSLSLFRPIGFCGFAGHFNVAKLSRERFIHFDKCLQQLMKRRGKKPFSFSKTTESWQKSNNFVHVSVFFVVVVENIVVYSASALQPNCLFPLSFFLMFGHKNGTNIEIALLHSSITTICTPLFRSYR